MRFNKLDLNLLVALDALLTEKSITRASARIHLSPSAMSNALGRLREYFNDELLVQIGRQMELTPRAAALQTDVRDVLNRIQATLAAEPIFDPSTSTRTFRVFATEYAQSVLGMYVTALAARQGFRGLLEFLAPTLHPHRDIERDEADLILIPESMASAHHPHELVFEEDFSCLVWAGSRWARQPPDAAQYLEARHAVIRPVPSFENLSLNRLGVTRQVAVVTPSFSVLPSLIVGTDYLATVHTRLAEKAVLSWPLLRCPMPLPIDRMPLVMQWHKYRTHDPGTVWLRGVFQQAVLDMQGVPAPCSA